MNHIALNLIVLRSSDMPRAAEFYSRMGLEFTRHQHGSGPERSAAELGGSVFELYPRVPRDLPHSAHALVSAFHHSIPQLPDSMIILQLFFTS